MKKPDENKKGELEQKINKKCTGVFCEWRSCLELQIKLLGDIQRKPAHCEDCCMWVE